MELAKIIPAIGMTKLGSNHRDISITNWVTITRSVSPGTPIEIKTKGESSESFLSGVWSSSAKVEKPKSVKDFVIWAQSETGDDYGDVKVYPIEEDIKIDGPLQRATFWLSVSPEVDPSQIFAPKPEDPDDGGNIELGDA